MKINTYITVLFQQKHLNFFHKRDSFNVKINNEKYRNIYGALKTTGNLDRKLLI